MKESICNDHIKKIRAGLRNVGADCLFAFSGTNIYYTSGCRIGPSDRLAAVIIPLDGEITIVSPGFEGARISREKLLGEVKTWEEDEDPFDLVAQIFRDKGLADGTIAVDDQLWFRVYERMRNDTPGANWINGGDIIAKARWMKSEEELQCIETACKYVAKGIELALKELKPGMSELDFSRIIGEKIDKVGGPVNGGALVQSGPNASDPHHPTDKRILQNGDAVVIDSGCKVDGFCADISRTLMIGKVDDEMRKAWEILKDAQQVSIDAVKPGVTCENIDAAARDYLEERGYGEYFTHRTGHGLGMEGHEPPYMVKGNKKTLEPGMSFTIEPGIYVPDKFGMRIEDDIACTESGPRMLSIMKKDWEITL